MKENKDLKKVRILYVVVIGLIFLIGGMFYYFQKRLDEVKETTESISTITIKGLQNVSKLVELNYLDTTNYKYIVNPKDWEESLKKQTGLTLDIPESWKLDKVIVRIENNKKESDNSLDEFHIFLNKSEDVTFNEFANNLYQKIHDNFEGEVLSFNDEKKYYDINSFEETSYNNMYYDYATYQDDGTYGGPRIKVKLLDDENGVKIEINKF